MFVIARNSTFVYKGKAVKVKQVAEELGVKYVLEGSVQKAGENLRVTAQLIDALKGNHLWSESYDRATKDFFSVQDYLNYYLGHLAVSCAMAGEHEKAIANLKKVIERAKEEGGQLIPEYAYLVNSYVSLGQMVEAKDCAAKILELDPNFSLENFQKSRFYKNPADLDRLLSNLRKAGLPE